MPLRIVVRPRGFGGKDTCDSPPDCRAAWRCDHRLLPESESGVGVPSLAYFKRARVDTINARLLLQGF